MKRFLLLVLTFIMVSTFVACADNSSVADDTQKPMSTQPNNYVGDNEHVTETETPNTDASDEYETEKFVLAESLFDKDDEGYQQMKSIQGNITAIDNGGTSPVFLVENKVYKKSFSGVSVVYELENTPEKIHLFDSMDMGENILAYANGRVTCYYDNQIRFDTQLDIETEWIAEISFSSYYFILAKKNEGYELRYYEINQDTKEIEYKSTEVVDDFDTSMGEDISEQIKEIVTLPTSNDPGTAIFCITKNNELYKVSNVNSDGFEMQTGTPLLTNVDKVYADSYVCTHLAAPVYSKIGNNSAVYSVVPGENLFSSDDNIEISFSMPDGHTPEEIKDMFECSGALVFVFENGDTYVTSEIERDEIISYSLTKLDVISKLNSEGKIVDMAGAQVLDNNIYVLMNNGKIYCFECE